jgi:hypothetical protein
VNVETCKTVSQETKLEMFRPLNSIASALQMFRRTPGVCAKPGSPDTMC